MFKYNFGKIKNRKTSFLLIVFVISIISMLVISINANALQNDSDLDTTIHASLITNSAEIQSTLLGLGTYTCFEDPELDIGSYSHDLTIVDVSHIQWLNETTNPKNNYELIGANATSGNHSGVYVDLSEYDLSAPFDSRISLFMNYSLDDSKSLVFNDTIDSSPWTLFNMSHKTFPFRINITQDTYAKEYDSNNYGQSETVNVGYGTAPYNGKYHGYFKDDPCKYSTLNATATTYIYMYYSQSGGGFYWVWYKSGNFDENVLTWYTGRPDTYGSLSSGSVASVAQWIGFSCGTGFPYYKMYVQYQYSMALFRSSESSDIANRPYTMYTIGKEYQGGGYKFVQANSTETLQLRSPVYVNKTTIYDTDYFNITLQTNTTKQVNLKLINDGSIVREMILLPSGNTNFNTQTVKVQSNGSTIQFNQLEISGEFDDTKYLKLYDVKTYGGWTGDFVEDVYVTNFTYQILGLNYTEEIIKLTRQYNNTNLIDGNYSYYFDSTELDNYDHVNDLIVPKQNINFTFDLNLGRNVSFSVVVNSSTSLWQVPTECSLRVNNEEVVDSTYNSGYVMLDYFPNTITISATKEIICQLNISSDFSFSFELDVLSKTYLRKEFELLSDHEIDLEIIDFSNDLELKEVYVNNIGYGSSDPTNIYPALQMLTGNIFYLDVLLMAEIYIPLQYYYDDLGSGTSNIYISGISNTLKYYDLTRFNSINLIAPDQMLSEYALLQFSNLQYIPYYSSNSSYNTNNMYSESQSYPDAQVSWDPEYHQTSANGTKIGEYDNNYTVLDGYSPNSNQFSFVNGSMVNYGNLSLIDGNYTDIRSSSPVNDTFTGMTTDAEEYWDERFTNKTTTEKVYYNSPDNFNLETPKQITQAGDIAWIDIISLPNNCKASLVAEYDNHKNVLNLTHDGGASDPAITHNFDVAQTSGTYEFWWATSDVTKMIYHYSNGNGGNAVVLSISGSKYYYMNLSGGWVEVIGVVPTNNHFDHHKIVFDCATDRFDWYINGVLRVNDGEFRYVQTYISNIMLYNEVSAAYSQYLSAPSEGWDASYKVGYNINPYDITQLLSIPNTNWLNGFRYGVSMNITQYFEGHKDVLCVKNDGVSDNNFYISSGISMTSGSFEYWFYTTDHNHYSIQYFYDSTWGTGYIQLVLGYGGEIRYNIGAGWITIVAINNNAWQHIRVDFETGAGSYKGLSADTWHIYVNGTHYGDFVFYNSANINDIKHILFGEDALTSIHYYDSPCFSWDNGYTIGDNINSYNISAFKSKGWTMNYAYPSSYVRINSSVDGHTNVLELHDNTQDISINDATAIYFPFTAQTSGTVEYYFRTQNSQYDYTISMMSAFNFRVIIIIQTGKLRAYYSGDYHDIAGCSISNNQWYHIRIEFECGNGKYKGLNPDTYNIYLDGIYKETIAMAVSATSIDQLLLGTQSYYYDSTYTLFVDDFSISTDKLEFTSTFQFSMVSMETVNNLKINYGQRTNLTCNSTGMYVWNFDRSSWDILNTSISDTTFYDVLFTLNSSHYNASYHFKLKWYIITNFDIISLYIDKLVLTVNTSVDDDDFNAIQYIWINDNIVFAHQSIEIYWLAFDDNPTNVIVSNKVHLGSPTNIFTIAIINNSFQSKSWINETAGQYFLNLTFYDIYSNWEKWSLNFTLHSSVSINLAYPNPTHVNELNNISTYIKATTQITGIHYDNSTNYLLKSASYPLTEINFTFSVNHSSAQAFNISVLVITSLLDKWWCNVSYLSCLKNVVYVDFNNLYDRYYQMDALNVSVYFRNIYNAQVSKTIQFDVKYQNGTDIMNGDVLSNTGIIFTSLNYSFNPGFYRLNLSSIGSDIYVDAWKMMSFELYPSQRTVNSTDINLKVNGHSVLNNQIQINYSTALTFSSLDNATYDLDIYCLFNHSHSLSYAGSLHDSFTFTASSQFTSIQITQANITGIPENFTRYYFNDQLSTNYILRGNNMQITELIGDSFYNGNDFNIKLYRFFNIKLSNQLTINPTTEDVSVEFEEYLYANRTFTYWYFINSLEINDIELEHIRSGTTIDTFTVNGSMYYFTESSLSGDQFTATVDYVPSWNVSYTILNNTGIYTKIRIMFISAFSIWNVSTIIDLSSSYCYNDRWTLGGTQNSNDLKLSIPNINFTSSYQYLTIEGYSDVPHANITSYATVYPGTRIIMGEVVEFAGYLEYTKYTNVFTLAVSSRWTCYDVHYGNNNQSIGVNSLSDSLVYVSGYGFNPNVNDSFIHFSTRPFTKVDWQFDDTIDVITITINSLLPVSDIYFLYNWDPSQQHSLEVQQSPSELIDLSDSGDYDGYLFFGMDELEAGTTIIKIYVNYVTEMEMLVQFVIVAAVLGIGIGLFYYFKYDDNARNKLEKFLNKQIVERLEKLKGEEKGLESVVLSVKDNKLVIKPEK